jgi:branched-chain amino acid transport system ATP-binding protein
MLSIARALASSPDLVLLDEPSEGLSPMMVQTIRAGILESRARGCRYSLLNKA